MYPGGQWVKVSHLICWLSQVNLIRQFVKRAEIQSRRLAWLRVCICFSFIFSLVVNLWWRREWKGNEKKKKKKHGKGSLTPHTSFLGAEQPRLQIILHKSKDSHSFHRGNHFRNIFLGLCSPQIQLITNGLYSEEHGILTWESMRNDKKYNDFHFMVLVLKMTELRIRSPQNLHTRWSCCHSGPQYCGF